MSAKNCRHTVAWIGVVPMGILAQCVAAAPPAPAPEPPAAPKAPASPAPALTLGKAFACTDYGGNKVCLVGADGKITWRMPARRPQDVWVLPDDHILFTHVKDVKEVTPDKKVVGVIGDYKQFSTISSVFIMGLKADPRKFELTK